jgi:hypothetical protein
MNQQPNRIDDANGLTFTPVVVAVNADGSPIGGGSGGVATTIADGADVAQGARADAAATTDTGTFSLIALVKRGLQNWTTLLARIPAAITPGLLPVDTLATLGVARQLSAGAASANTALTASTRRVSIHARLADIRYVIGTGVQTASGTSHYIASGERLDLDVPASAQIAVIRAGTTDAVLEVSELV